VERISTALGVSPLKRILTKFSSGETRCEIQDSLRGKDVYIIQSFGVGTAGDRVNDYFIELCIMISACQMSSAQRVTVVMPLFPYSRQPDLPYTKAGAPRSAKPASEGGSSDSGRHDYTFESVPATPGPSIPPTAGIADGVDILDMIHKSSLPSNNNQQGNPPRKFTTHDYENVASIGVVGSASGYKLWMAQAGSLVADLITCSGADRVLTSDLHESTYQGFFNIPGKTCLSVPRRQHRSPSTANSCTSSRQPLLPTPSHRLHQAPHRELQGRCHCQPRRRRRQTRHVHR
jgi:ribose-phosphate pyrophosphokinase